MTLNSTQSSKPLPSSSPFISRLSNVLKDAALLRIMEAAGYASIPEDFYKNIPQD